MAPAGGQHDRAAAHRTDAVALPFAHHVQRDAGDPVVIGEQQVHGERVLDDLDLRRTLDRSDQGALDLRAGRVATGVRDAVAVVPALAGQRELAVGVVVEDGAERDQLAYGFGALLDQDPDGLEVAPPGPGDEGVDLVLRGRVLGTERGRDAALGPLRRPGGQHVLGDDQDPVDLPGQAERSGEARDPRADHHDVGPGRPTRLWGGEPAG